MEKLYYKDQYIKEFTAEIVDIIEMDDKYHIELDKTAFFPGGGGQVCDLGKIDNHRVIDVYENNSKVFHVLDKKPIKIHKVKCSIDWERREDNMHQHFAQHVISGSFYTLFKANTVAVHFGREISTVDIDGYLTPEQIRQAEAYINEIIRENIEVETLLPSKKELKKIWIRRDLPDTSDEIRILKIGELDSNACCGVHPKSTIDLRMIKLKKWEKNKGATRIEYLAGKRAVDYFLKRDEALIEICRYLSSTDEEAINGIKGIHEKLEDALYKVRKLEEVVASYELKDLVENSSKINDIAVIIKTYEDENLKYISKLATKITEYENTIALLGVKSDDKVNLVFASSKNIKNANMNNLLKDAITLVDGRGGGSSSLAQGGGKNNGNLENSLDYAFSKLERTLQ